MHDFGIDPATHVGHREVTTRWTLSSPQAVKPRGLRLLSSGADGCDTPTAGASTFSAQCLSTVSSAQGPGRVRYVVTSDQQDRQKYVTNDDVILVYQLVSMDKLRPINRQSMAGYHYVTKFVDQRTKLKADFSHERQDPHYQLYRLLEQWGRGFLRPAPCKAPSEQRYGLHECRGAAV